MATSLKHPDVIDIPGAICGYWRDLRYAVAFLTILPVAPSRRAAEIEGEQASGDCLRRSTVFFPLVGAGIGLVAGLMLIGAFELGLQPLSCALIGLASAALLTGALHEDGLADFFDGLGASGSAEKRLAVMRDSRIGTFGALAVVFGVGIRASILSSLSSADLAMAALIAGGAASRSMMPIAMRWQRPARTQGLSANAGAPSWPQVTAACAIAFIIALVTVGLWGSLAIGVAVAFAVLLIAMIAQKAFGGQTGDVLGAMQVAAETVALATVAMLE